MNNSIAGHGFIATMNGSSFAHLRAALVMRLRAARARQIARRELAAMSALELADMGITRHDVGRLFDPRQDKRPEGDSKCRM